MKRIVLTALSFVAIGAASPHLFGQAKSTEQPSLLYEVSGKDLTKPSYIFGTFHAICPTEMVPLASLDGYLAKTDQLMMEIDMDNTAEMTSMAGSIMMAGGKTLKDFLTVEEFAKVDEMVKSYLGFPADTVKMLKPTMLTILTLTSPKSIGCKPVTYDLDLMKSAVAKKKSVVGLETVESQVKVLDSVPLDKQAKDLYKMALDPPKASAELKNLMLAYKLQDPEKLFEATEKQLKKDDKEFHARLLDDRNIAWIPKLETAFKEKPTFVAVGAGHLGGTNGVIKLLRAKGYQVSPVKL